MAIASEIISQLQSLLNSLNTHPYPRVDNPPNCKKRASVAVIIRVRPAFSPSTKTSLSKTFSSDLPPNSIDAFFAQPWVQSGDPEALFIKRAGRAGDRWSGHIALPGGRRDPEDDSDRAAAVRETLEEVGLDLTSPEVLEAGNLPERIVATTFGKVPLMVLCPYIFLYTSRETPRTKPQPTEVASCHWVSLRALLNPELRTSEYVDTASRMAKQGGPVLTRTLRALIGRMCLSAVRLVPSESVYASAEPGFLPSTTSPRQNYTTPQSQPLHLWGLTLGVLADFLNELPPYNAVALWKYPTFTPWDLKLFVYVFTYTLRVGNAHDLSAGTWPYSHNRNTNPARPDQREIRRRRPSQTAMDATSYASAVTEGEPTTGAFDAKDNEVGMFGNGIGKRKEDAVGRLLEGYYRRMNIAIGFFLLYRILFFGVMARYAWRWWKRKAKL